MKNNILQFLFVFSVFLGCSSVDLKTTAQQGFISEIEKYQEDYDKYDGNEIAQSDVADLMLNYIKDFGKVEKWYGEVEEINSSLGSQWVDVTFNNGANIEVKLWPEGTWSGNEGHPVFKQLLPGDRIYYSGKMTGEMSFTESGRMSNPEIKIDPIDIIKID
tara:strand:- start:8725 stop:9207 length:483 start_codon:yes stop_codon:yes gene_type:complete